MKISIDDRFWMVVADWPRQNKDGEWVLYREVWRFPPIHSLKEAQEEWADAIEMNWKRERLHEQPKVVCYIELTLRTDGSIIQTQQVPA